MFGGERVRGTLLLENDLNTFSESLIDTSEMVSGVQRWWGEEDRGDIAVGIHRHQYRKWASNQTIIIERQ